MEFEDEYVQQVEENEFNLVSTLEKVQELSPNEVS